MVKELIVQLTQWHEEDEHQKIVDTLIEIPPTDRDYETINRLGRAYNNLERYEEALEQFAMIAEQGQNDPLWYFRVGYSYYLHKEQHAAVRRVIREQHNDSGTAATPFEGMDIFNFWDDSDYALKEYVSAPPTDELIASVEEELGYKLPASYITLMKQHNGGVPYPTCFPTEDATSWAEDHIAITGGGEFGQGGYAPGWISDWLDGRIHEGLIVQDNGILRFTDEARASVIARLEAEAADTV